MKWFNVKNTNIRVCVLASQSLTSATMEMVIIPVCNYLSKNNMTISVILLHHYLEGAKKRDLEINDNLKAKYVGQMMVKKMGDHKEYMPFPNLLYCFLKSLFGMITNVMMTRYDVLLAVKPHPHIVITALIAKIFKHRPILLFSDDYEAESNKISFRILKKIFNISDIIAAKIADSIIVPTRFMENIYRNYTSVDKLYCIPNGIDPHSYDVSRKSSYGLKEKLGIPVEDKVILYAGVIQKTQGHRVDLLVQAFKKLGNENNKVWLIIAGSGESDYIQKLQEDYPDNNGRMIFTGRYEIDEISDYYNMADIIVDPVDDSIVNRAKGSSRILLAKVFGKPVVTSDVGDRKEWVGNGGVIVKANCEEMRKAFETILSDDEKIIEMGKYAAESLENYSFDNTGKLYRSVILETVNL